MKEAEEKDNTNEEREDEEKGENEFDIFEDLNSELENAVNKVLRLTHTKTVRKSGVASIDNVWNTIRKNKEIEHMQNE